MQIVAFEGLDCSFKETNSIGLANYIGDKAKRYEFPDYKNERSYYIRQYLGKKYNGISKLMIMDMYLMEMYDKWHTDIQEDIKNGIEVLIFDRFWYSGLYYNCSTIKERYLLEKLVSDKYKLPSANIIFKMITDLNLMLKKIHKKNSGDIYESDDKAMIEIYNRFKDITFNCGNQFDIPITSTDINGDPCFMDRDDIISSITATYDIMTNII